MKVQACARWFLVRCEHNAGRWSRTGGLWVDLGTTTIDIRLGPLKHIYGLVDTWRFKIFVGEDSKAWRRSHKIIAAAWRALLIKNQSQFRQLVVTQVESQIRRKNIWTSWSNLTELSPDLAIDSKKSCVQTQTNKFCCFGEDEIKYHKEKRKTRWLSSARLMSRTIGDGAGATPSGV